MKNKWIANIIRGSINVLFYACMGGLVWVLAQVLLIASFKIPTDSMAPEVIAGDRVLVLKPILGARLFDLFGVAKEQTTPIYRLPGIKHVKRNEVVVFNFPCPQSWDKIEMNLMSYYIKRCIALPGDTLTIKNGFYGVEGVQYALGNISSQESISGRNRQSFEKGVFRTFPYDSIMDWNIKDFGPLYIPRKDDIIPMNRTNYVLYKKLIEWETQDSLSFVNDLVYLKKEAIATYRFQKNYYFMAGDRVEDSQDSMEQIYETNPTRCL